VCTRVGSQWSRGVVTAWVQTDVVRSLCHERRDLHQSTYPVPLRRLGLILLSPRARFWMELDETLAPHACRRCAREHHPITAQPCLITSRPPNRSPMPPKPKSNRTLSRAMFECSPPLEIYQGEFAIPRRPRTSRPY
jgi:hypothetical protein